MIFIGAAISAAALLLIGCGIRISVNQDPVPGNGAPGNNTPGNEEPGVEKPENGSFGNELFGSGANGSGNSASAGSGTNAENTGSAGNSGSGSESPAAIGIFGKSVSVGSAYAVKSTLKEISLADPEKGIGAYGRYTELSAEGEVPAALSMAISEMNELAKTSVEAKVQRFLSENDYPAAEKGEDFETPYRYRNISCIVNVTRADDALFSILVTEMESGLGDKKDAPIDGIRTSFRAAVFDTQTGKKLELSDFFSDPGTIGDRLDEALHNKYGVDGLYAAEDAAAAGAGKTGADAGTAKTAAVPAWTANYLGLSFYFDRSMISEEKKSDAGIDRRRAVHVSIPYTALDGRIAEAAAKTPESFIAEVEKNTEYALPHDKRIIRVEKGDNDGYEQYRIVIRDGKKEEAWWLEYADDRSEFYVFRAGDAYYFYRLEDNQDRAYVYNFARPDGGYNRFENQNAQCFDSFLHEVCMAVPYNPDCVHMRERSRKFMDSKSGLNTYFVPTGHYAFRPEPGRGRTWLHFALIDDVLAIDTRNVGLRLLHEISAKTLDEAGNETGETVIPAGEVLQVLQVDGESELYYYMSQQYNTYQSGARDYFYDCALTDGSRVRLTTRYENSFFVDGMYMDRIGEAVTLAGAQYEAGLGEVPEHYVEIAGKQYKLIRDLSLQSEAGEEIDFDGDIWWKVENYVGTYTSHDPEAKLEVFENGDVSFEFDGNTFTGKLPEKRFYRRHAAVYLEAGYERRTFQFIVMDEKAPHDPDFTTIRFYSEGLPATNVPSTMPPIEVELTREAGKLQPEMK